MQFNGPSSAGFMYSDTGGDGPAVVFLHGVLTNGSLWNPIVDKLRDRYRCIVPELPFGAHRTPMPDDADLDLASLAKMIADFLVELDLHDVTLVCNDWGGAQLVIAPDAERLAEHFENAELAWVDDSRTLIPIDQPEILAGHLERFLARTT